MSDLNGNHVAHVLDPQEVLEAAEESMFGMENLGFCIACGAEHYGCEPDACNYECEECGMPIEWEGYCCASCEASRDR